MSSFSRKLFVVGIAAAFCLCVPALAGVHTWDVEEIFSNADGTVQFIELQEWDGGPAEGGVSGPNLASSTESYDILSNVAAPTTYRCILFATPAYAALPGAVTPDFVFDGATQVPFFSTSGSTISFTGIDSKAFVAGQLPTDGVHSLNKEVATGSLVSRVASPTNYAGTNPPAVPETMKASRVDALGTSITVTFDRKTCCSRGNFQILYGVNSQLPTSVGGTFGLTGSVCSIVPAAPAPIPTFAWDLVPPVDPGTFLWWVIAATNSPATIEGSWGAGKGAIERIGPGAGGSSGQCGVTTRDLTNTCGH